LQEHTDSGLDICFILKGYTEVRKKIWFAGKTW